MAELSQSVAADEEYLCPLCGTWVTEINEFSGWCLDCHPETPLAEDRWLRHHADRVEDYMLEGYSFTASKKMVYAENRPICIVCEEPIKGGKPNNYFCTTKVLCRRFQRRYRTLREGFVRKGFSKEIAFEAGLEQVVREIEGERTYGDTD